MSVPVRSAVDTPRLRCVLALISGKGGVGKSTLALALGDAFASRGHRVAVVDLDPQGGATLAAGVTRPEDPLAADPSPAHGFMLYPSGRPLADAPVDALAARLSRAHDSADVLVLDLSPSLTDAAHMAAMQVATLAVVIARTDAAGLPNAGEAVGLAKASGVPFVVVPSIKGPTGLAREAEAFLRGRYGEAVASTAIPLDAKAAEAAGLARPVTQTAKRAKVSQAVHALADELVQRMGGTA